MSLTQFQDFDSICHFRNEIQANRQLPTECRAFHHMSMFRASPWVTYEPNQQQTNPASANDMDDDLNNMDAPQISTLREEETPPPQRTSSSNKRAKVTKAKASEYSAWARPVHKTPNTEEEYDDPEEEEDQLIDDDDDELMKPTPPSALQARMDLTLKKKASSKRKPRKTEKRVAEEERKAREKVLHATAASLAPTMTCFEATPSETYEDRVHLNPGNVVMNEQDAPKTMSSKKKASPRKATAASVRVKVKVPPKPKATAIPIHVEDLAPMSEGTPASSPPAHFDANTPEPENTDSTGFAPIIPLDRSLKKVRIAGGRWFARSWVGEKDSDFAGVWSVALPKLPTMSISAPVAGRSGKSKASKANSSIAASAVPSRDGSSVPDAVPPVGPVRAPTKMRILQLAPGSEAGDSDMAVFPES
ncbi:hypothetical protein BD779DRAFT_1487790 [Infundibulicybe gibba]|nr:hypothetical protein BD779DRAFT_1487790 [Infundibulicybe gibba]